jgi:hypothetical protein
MGGGSGQVHYAAKAQDQEGPETELGHTENLFEVRNFKFLSSSSNSGCGLLTRSQCLVRVGLLAQATHRRLGLGACSGL